MLSNFNHLLEIDAYSTQWMDDTHMRHIKYFRTERIAVNVYILIMISIGQYLYCTCRSHTFVCAWNFLFQPKKTFGHENESSFHNFPIKSLHKYVSFQIRFCWPLLCRGSHAQIPLAVQERPGRDTPASAKPCEPRAHISSFFCEESKPVCICNKWSSYECYIPNI